MLLSHHAPSHLEKWIVPSTKAPHRSPMRISFMISITPHSGSLQAKPFSVRILSPETYMNRLDSWTLSKGSKASLEGTHGSRFLLTFSSSGAGTCK